MLTLHMLKVMFTLPFSVGDNRNTAQEIPHNDVFVILLESPSVDIVGKNILLPHHPFM